MVIGIALYGWDQKQGAVLESVYPRTFQLAESAMNKVYMTHAYSKDFQSDELIELSYEDKFILSYCDKRHVKDAGYEIITLVIHEKEKISSYKLKKQLLDFAREVIHAPKNERNNIFLKKVEEFFEKPSSKKILLLGRASTGKTTIKKIIFEGINPKDLLYNSLEPTRGITPSVYSWLDLNLGLFDSSGQELQFILINDNEQKLAFENSDAIIYIFDYQIWISNSREIIAEIKNIADTIKKNSYSSKFFLFLHKIDLINEETRESEILKLEKSIKEKIDSPIFFTSIYPNLIYSLYNAFYKILSGFSDETIKLKRILDEKIKEIAKIMCFITDQNNSIMVQTMSNDFDTKLINHSHNLIAQINQTFEDMSKPRINHLIISSTDNLNIIMNNLNLMKFGIKNLIGISETLSANKLIWLMGQIRTSLNRYLYFNKTD